MIYVKDILERKGRTVVTVRRDQSLLQAAKLLRDHNIGALIVVDEDDNLAGVISERDIVWEVARNATARAVTVAEAMTSDVRTCRPDDSVQELMGWMTRYRTRHYPVVHGDNVEGIVSIGDIVKHRLIEMETETNVLRDILVSKP